MKKLLSLGALAIVLVVLSETTFAATNYHPKAPGAAGAIQVGATSSVAGTDRAEMQLEHACPIAVPVTPGAAYSYSLVGVTDKDFVIRMGYLVRQSDGVGATCYNTPDSGSQCCSGWGRWFIQVLRSDGSEAYYKESRAGEANPPPASSASSGDGTMNGYPFSFGRVGNDTWNFWFDWVSKARVRVAGSGNQLKQLYFLAELSGTNGVLGDVVGPRTALTTFRYWNGSTWVEPSSAVSFATGGTPCPLGYGVEAAGLGPARANGRQYHATSAGSDVTCDSDGLW